MASSSFSRSTFPGHMPSRVTSPSGHIPAKGGSGQEMSGTSARKAAPVVPMTSVHPRPGRNIACRPARPNSDAETEAFSRSTFVATKPYWASSSPITCPASRPDRNTAEQTTFATCPLSTRTARSPATPTAISAIERMIAATRRRVFARRFIVVPFPPASQAAPGVPMRLPTCQSADARPSACQATHGIPSPD